MSRQGPKGSRRGGRGGRRRVNPNFGGGAGMQVKSFAALYASARSTGKLRLANRSLSSVPPEVCNLLDEKNISVDEKWWECVALTSLDLNNNDITQLPAEMKNLSELVVLEVAHNKLAEFCVQVSEITTLKKLNFRDNALGAVPRELGVQTSLVELDLSQNKIRDLPSLAQLAHLEVLRLNNNELRRLEGLPSRLLTLDISHNKLEVVDDSIAQLGRLGQLNAGYNNLRGIPSLLGLKSVAVVNLEHNQLSEVPALPRGKHLQEVCLANNQLKGVDGVMQCSGLSTLVLTGNQISKLPENIDELPLRTLDVSNNALQSVPPRLGLLESLNHLLLSGNYLRGFKRSVLSQPVEEIKKYLRTKLPADEAKELVPAATVDMEMALRDAKASGVLKLSGCGLEQPPMECLSLALHDIDLSRNKIAALPNAFASLGASLQRLSLERNRLESLSNVIGGLPRLRELNLRYNTLAEVPAGVSSCSSLEVLDLRNNKFRSISANILGATSVKHLFMGFNEITQVPSLHSLKHLEELDLSNNKVASMAEGLRSMSTLQILNLENNNLSKLPFELGLMSNLKTLMCVGNPLRTIPFTTLKSGSAKLKSYLRGKIPRDSPLLADFKDDSASLGPGADTSTLDKLNATIANLTARLEDVSLSSAKKYALKKELAREKAKRIREERRLKAAQ